MPSATPANHPPLFKGVALFKRFPRFRLPLATNQELISPVDQAQYPDFADDFAMLEETLMPDFRAYDREALRAQNQFHLQQVILLLGSVLATILGAIQVTLAALTRTSLIAGLAEAVVAALLAGVAQVAQVSKAQQRYFRSRLKAETVRAEYFLFLSHLAPYENQLRQERLRKRLVAIKISNENQQMSLAEQENGHLSQPKDGDKQDRLEHFWRLYHRYRYVDQLHFYQARQEEFEQAQVQATLFTIAFMTAATIVSLLGSANLFGFSTGWSILAVLFPILATALATYVNLYAFERQAELYKDAGLALETIGMPSVPETTAEAMLPDYVARIEHIFMAEQGQWGQLVSQIKTALNEKAPQ